MPDKLSRKQPVLPWLHRDDQGWLHLSVPATMGGLAGVAAAAALSPELATTLAITTAVLLGGSHVTAAFRNFHRRKQITGIMNMVDQIEASTTLLISAEPARRAEWLRSVREVLEKVHGTPAWRLATRQLLEGLQASTTRWYMDTGATSANLTKVYMDYRNLADVDAGTAGKLSQVFGLLQMAQATWHYIGNSGDVDIALSWNLAHGYMMGTLKRATPEADERWLKKLWMSADYIPLAQVKKKLTAPAIPDRSIRAENQSFGADAPAPSWLGNFPMAFEVDGHAYRAEEGSGGIALYAYSAPVGVQPVMVYPSRGAFLKIWGELASPLSTLPSQPGTTGPSAQ